MRDRSLSVPDSLAADDVICLISRPAQLFGLGALTSYSTFFKLTGTSGVEHSLAVICLVIYEAVICSAIYEAVSSQARTCPLPQPFPDNALSRQPTGAPADTACLGAPTTILGVERTWNFHHFGIVYVSHSCRSQLPCPAGLFTNHQYLC